MKRQQDKDARKKEKVEKERQAAKTKEEDAARAEQEEIERENFERESQQRKRMDENRVKRERARAEKALKDKEKEIAKAKKEAIERQKEATKLSKETDPRLKKAAEAQQKKVDDAKKAADEEVVRLEKEAQNIRDVEKARVEQLNKDAAEHKVTDPEFNPDPEFDYGDESEVDDALDEDEGGVDEGGADAAEDEVIDLTEGGKYGTADKAKAGVKDERTGAGDWKSRGQDASGYDASKAQEGEAGDATKAAQGRAQDALITNDTSLDVKMGADSMKPDFRTGNETAESWGETLTGNKWKKISPEQQQKIRQAFEQKEAAYNEEIANTGYEPPSGGFRKPESGAKWDKDAHPNDANDTRTDAEVAEGKGIDSSTQFNADQEGGVKVVDEGGVKIVDDPFNQRPVDADGGIPDPDEAWHAPEDGGAKGAADREIESAAQKTIEARARAYAEPIDDAHRVLRDTKRNPDGSLTEEEIIYRERIEALDAEDVAMREHNVNVDEGIIAREDDVMVEGVNANAQGERIAPGRGDQGLAGGPSESGGMPAPDEGFSNYERSRIY